jgi:hypothetical protein
MFLAASVKEKSSWFLELKWFLPLISPRLWKKAGYEQRHTIWSGQFSGI